MSNFFKELKELRKESGIEIEEIHNRTKISLQALRAIESGQFDQLPNTYIRLFVRAYANEIGADEDETLHELNKLIDDPLVAKKGPEKKSPINLKKTDQNEDAKVLDKIKQPSISVKNNRFDIIKGIVLVFTLIFSIYIIRQINKEEAAKSPISYPSEFEEEGPITNQILQNDFDLFTESVQILEENAPFTLKMATVERVWYKTKIDSLNFVEGILPSGDNRLYEFSDSLKVLFKYSKGLNLYLNGTSIKSFKPSSDPLQIIFSTVNKTVTTQQYIPKN